MNTESLICPGTLLHCPGKAYLAKMLGGICEAQIGTELAATPGGLTEQQADISRQEVIRDFDDKRNAVERDLAADCNGSGICRPLALTATRYLLDGPSVTEMLGDQPA